jgi:AraC-like DNA-binding protein
VRLAPAGAFRLVPALPELVDRAADGDAALPALAARLRPAAEAMEETGDVAPLENALRAALAAARGVDPRLARASALLAGDSAGGVDAVARAVGLTPRHLGRLFERSLGVSPKLLARIARFRRAFALGMRGRRGDWAAIAATAGYADQSHLSREFRALGGAPPERLRAAIAGVDV